MQNVLQLRIKITYCIFYLILLLSIAITVSAEQSTLLIASSTKNIQGECAASILSQAYKS